MLRRPPGLLVVLGIVLFVAAALVSQLGGSDCSGSGGEIGRDPQTGKQYPVPAVDHTTCALAWITWFTGAIGVLLVVIGLTWSAVRLVQSRRDLTG